VFLASLWSKLRGRMWSGSRFSVAFLLNIKQQQRTKELALRVQNKVKRQHVTKF
jgi:hypothetical protein